MLRVGDTARNYADIADAAILLGLRAAPRPNDELRDDIAARCGGARLFDNGIKRLREREWIFVQRKEGRATVYDLTAAGRARADELHREQTRRTRAA